MSQNGKFARLRGCGWSTLTLTRAELANAQRRAEQGHPGAAVVNSCQRLEVYSDARCDCDAPDHWGGLEAVAHLAEVAAGLHSVVLGEEQILGQVRQAFKGHYGLEREAADIAVGAARELRQETNFDSHAGALLDRALTTSGLPAAGALLVIGTGAMGRLVAERGKFVGFDEITVAGRAEPKWLQTGWRYLPLASLPGGDDYAVGVACLGSNAEPVDAARFTNVRHLLVDLGTPRNFEGVTPVPLLALADLFADESRRPHALKRRAALRLRLSAILQSRLRDSEGRDSPIGTLRFEVERIRLREIERMQRLHPEIDPATLDVLTRSLVNQIFHRPSERLKSLDDGELSHALAGLFSEETVFSEAHEGR